MAVLIRRSNKASMFNNPGIDFGFLNLYRHVLMYIESEELSAICLLLEGRCGMVRLRLACTYHPLLRPRWHGA
jgi:hypothetical protein